MISRKTTQMIAALYSELFNVSYRSDREWKEKLNNEKIYDFLYENEYQSWFLNIVRNLYSYNARALKDIILKLHTGETQYAVTTEWGQTDREKLGQRYLKNLAEDILNYVDGSDSGIFIKSHASVLRSRLELDGYILKEGVLYQTSDSAIDDSKQQLYLTKLVSETGLNGEKTINHHLAKAESHYLEGNWDDSISNSRKFFEAILSQSAAVANEKTNGKPISRKKLDSPKDVRDILLALGLIEEKEKQAIAKVYSLLSDTGGHPYIAEQDQARLMRELALVISQFVLLRLLGLLNAKR